MSGKVTDVAVLQAVTTIAASAVGRQDRPEAIRAAVLDALLALHEAGLMPDAGTSKLDRQCKRLNTEQTESILIAHQLCEQ